MGTNGVIFDKSDRHDGAPGDLTRCKEPRRHFTDLL